MSRHPVDVSRGPRTGATDRFLRAVRIAARLESDAAVATVSDVDDDDVFWCRQQRKTKMLDWPPSVWTAREIRRKCTKSNFAPRSSSAVAERARTLCRNPRIEPNETRHCKEEAIETRTLFNVNHQSEWILRFGRSHVFEIQLNRKEKCWKLRGKTYCANYVLLNAVDDTDRENRAALVGERSLIFTRIIEWQCYRFSSIANCPLLRCERLLIEPVYFIIIVNLKW